MKSIIQMEIECAASPADSYSICYQCQAPNSKQPCASPSNIAVDDPNALLHEWNATSKLSYTSPASALLPDRKL